MKEVNKLLKKSYSKIKNKNGKEARRMMISLNFISKGNRAFHCQGVYERKQVSKKKVNFFFLFFMKNKKQRETNFRELTKGN